LEEQFLPYSHKIGFDVIGEIRRSNLEQTKDVSFKHAKNLLSFKTYNKRAIIYFVEQGFNLLKAMEQFHI
jgi:predicted translin family RNA/ssDNA-binding protein